MSGKKADPMHQEENLRKQLADVLHTYHINLQLLPVVDRARLLEALCDTFFHSEEAMEWAEQYCRDNGWKEPA